MYGEYSADTVWEKVTPNQDVVDIDLDLTINEFLQGKDVAVELQNNREGIRQEIFDFVVTRILPGIIAGTGQPTTVPGTLRWNTKINDSSSCIIFENPANGIVANSRMRIKMNISTDRPVNPIAALNAARGSLADAIANNIVFSLANQYLGETASETETEFSI
jgi:hypothetical protein